MTVPYSICHPCPMAGSALRHCSELEHCSRKDHQCPRSRHRARYTVLALVARNAPVGSTSPPSSKALDAKTHDAHRHKLGHAHKHTHTNNWRRHAHAHSHSDEKGTHVCMRRWVWRHGGHESSGDQRTKASTRRPSSTRCKRKAKQSRAKLPLI